MQTISILLRLFQIPLFFLQNFFILAFATVAAFFEGLSQVCSGYRVVGPVEWTIYTHLDVQKIHLNGLMDSDDDNGMAYVPNDGGEDECQSA